MVLENDYLLSKALLENRILPAEEINTAMREVSDARRKGKKLSLRDVLLNRRLLTEAQIEAALKSLMTDLASQKNQELFAMERRRRRTQAFLALVIVGVLFGVIYWLAQNPPRTTLPTPPDTAPPVPSVTPTNAVADVPKSPAPVSSEFSVQVATTQTGAEIFLDNKKMGVSPLKVTAPAGEHTLLATLPGYNPTEKKLEFGPNAPANVMLEMSTLSPVKGTETVTEQWYYGGLSRTSPNACYRRDLRRSAHSPYRAPQKKPEPIWRQPLQNNGRAEILCLNENSALVSPMGGMIIQVDLSTKKVVRSFDIPTSQTVAVVGENNQVWQVSANGELAGFDGLNMQKVPGPAYKIKGGNEPQGQMLLGEDGVLYHSAGSKVFAVNNKTMTTVWERDIAGEIIHSLAATADGKIIAASYTGRIVALNKKTGEIFWDKKLINNQTMTSSPAMMDSVREPIVISPMENIYVVTERGGVYAINSKDGVALWKLDLLAPVTAPAVTRDVIYLTANKELLALNAMSGVRHWTRPLPVQVESAPVIDSQGGAVLVVTVDGVLRAYNNQGVEMWTTLVGNTAGSLPVIGPNEMIYISLAGGEFVALGVREGSAPDVKPIEIPQPPLRPKDAK